MIFLSQPPYKAPKWDEHPTSWSMLGWSPYYGGMTSIIRKVLDKTSDVWTKDTNGILRMKPLVYADNFWAVGEDVDGEETWFSMDGVKAEAHVTANDCKLLVKHFQRAYQGVSATWMRYMLTWYPVLSVNAIGVLGTQQLPCEFLGSGSPGTAYLNTLATIDYVSRLITNSKNNVWKEYVDPVTHEVKIGPWQDAETESARTYKCEMKVSLNELTSSSEEVRIDLLGYSCIPGHNWGMKGHWIPILDSPRLYKAISFYKTDLVAGEELNPVTQAINFFRYRVFYALGGWFDPGLSEIIVTRCAAIKGKLKDIVSQTTSLPLKEIMLDIASSLSLDQLPGGEGLLSFGSPITVPTMYDVFNLTVGAEAADMFVDWTFHPDTVGKPWTYLPYKLFLVEAEKREYDERPVKVAYNNDVLGQLEDSTMTSDLYDAIVKAQPNPWAMVPGSSVAWDEEVTPELRAKLEDQTKTYSGEQFKLPTVSKLPTSVGKPVISVQGVFSRLDRDTRNRLGHALVPVLSMALHKVSLFVVDPKDAKQVETLVSKIASYMNTPLSIVKRALTNKTVKAGTPKLIPVQTRDKYFQTPEHIDLIQTVEAIQSSGSLPF
jgi:hypothetical protein